MKTAPLLSSKGILALSSWLLALNGRALAGERDVKGHLGQLPVIAESQDKGILVDYLKAMQKAYPEGRIDFDVVPLERSLQAVASKESDFHAPLLKDPVRSERELGFAYSDASIFNVTFVLYMNKDKRIDKKNFKAFNVETDVAAVRFLDPSLKPSSCVECSLKKVNAGRIDGYIYAGLECDQTVRKLNLRNIRSTEFRRFEGKFIVPLNPRGDKVNAILTQVVDRTKKNGDFQKILGPINDYYKNWKPMTD